MYRLQKKLQRFWGTVTKVLYTICTEVLNVLTLVLLPVLIIVFCVLLVSGETDNLLSIAVMLIALCFISTAL